MPTDITTLPLSELVSRAAAIVDPAAADPAVAEFEARYEDADEPVRGILSNLIERIRWGADELEPVVMAQAIVLYLAHRLDEYDDDPEELLRLAARAEFDGHPPENIVRWLSGRGIEL
jgi:hypothetical protein